MKLKIVRPTLCALAATLSLLGILLPVFVFGQADTIKENSWSHRGYVKNLQTWAISGDLDNMISGGFFHYREQISWEPSEHFSMGSGIRTRLFYGEWVRFQPGWSDLLDTDPGLVDMSFVPIDKSSLLGSVIIDRLWGQWQKGKWQVRLGRQRINWAMALLWNPNDLFNAYNFIDFDYEERPGNDALRIKYQLGDFKEIEWAVAPGKNNWKEVITAFKYNGHLGYYDFQLLTGLYRQNLAVGGGWAGNLGNMGFKGESTYFQPVGDNPNEASLSASMGLDGLFGSSWFWTAGFLINTNGAGESIDLNQLSQTNLSPDRLMPGKFSTTGSLSYAITPLVNTALNLVYSPNGDLLILIPSVAWSAAPNWDVDLLAQGFRLGQTDTNQTGVFLRIRFSY